MGLSPEAFWSLTYREFQIKYAAFVRAENRQRALVMEHALMTSGAKGSERESAQREIYALRRYPEKSWLK